jgi:hypothetical protein
MPDPADYSDRNAWMEACVPAVMDEGKDHEAAVGQCMGMWNDRGKAAPTVERRAIPKMVRAYSRLEIKGISEEQRSISGIATTPTVDRIGDIVEPLGAKFAVPLALCLDHKHEQQVGHVEFLNPTKSGIPFRASIVKFDEPGEVKNLVDKAWHLVKTKLRSFVSIGFRPFENAVEFMENGGLRFKEWEFLELSLVSIPANMEAVIYEAKSLDAALQGLRSIDTDRLAASGQSMPAPRPGATGTKRTTITPVSLKERAKMSKTIAEQIEGLQAARAQKSARMNAIMAKTIEDGRSTDEAEQEEFTTLEREVDQIDGDLERFVKLEKLNVKKATPVSNVQTVDDGAAVRSSGGYIRVKAQQLPPGIRFARYAKCMALSRLDSNDAVRVAEKHYGDDQSVVNMVKAAVGAGNTLDPNWAGNLVSDEGAVFADFLEFLRPMTIVGKFGNDGIPALARIPFRVPVGTQTSGGAGYWTGEGQAKPLTRFDFGKTSLEPLKVANICVVTEELLRYASINAEQRLRDQLAAAITARIDTDFIDPAKTAVTNISPASITNGVTPVASSGVDADAVRADVAALIDTYIAANNPMLSAVWVMSARTASRLSMMYNLNGGAEFPGVTIRGGTFAGFPVIVSEYVTTSGGSPNTRYVWLVNASDVFFADEGGITVDMSREASLQMDSAPTMASAESGSPQLPIPTTSVSMFQTNSVAFRAERTLNWAKARTEAVQGLSGVVWGT